MSNEQVDNARKALLVLACLDHNCRVLSIAGIKRGGMGTNGGCRCFHDDFSNGEGYIRIQRIINAAEIINRNRIAELEAALREIVLYAKPKYRSTRDKAVRDGICLSGSLMHYEVMPHVIHAGKNLILQEQKS